MLHFSQVLHDANAFDDVGHRALRMGFSIREGRMLASAKPVTRAFCERYRYVFTNADAGVIFPRKEP